MGGDTNHKNLHAYGDEDGKGFSAKLQHALGLCTVIPDTSHSSNSEFPTVLVADTYNHKIKKITLNSTGGQASVESWVGSGNSGMVNDDEEVKGSDSKVEFSEPTGLCCTVNEDGNRIIYVADSNNNQIR